MLLAAGGAILLVQAIAPPTAVVELATGAMALVSAAGLFLLIRQLRAGDEPSLTAALPLMFFGVFLVLAIYLPFASDPILERYWLPVLAAAAQAFSLAQLTGFFRRESKPRQFLFAGNTAVFLCLATLADPLPLAVRLLLAGSAVTLATFTLLLQKAE